MAYKPGVLMKTTAPCPRDKGRRWCYSHRKSEQHRFWDSTTDAGDDVEHPAVALPHSCEEWVIGGVEEAKALIRDLQGFVDEHERRQR